MENKPKYNILDALMQPAQDAVGVLEDKKTYKKPGVMELEAINIDGTPTEETPSVMDHLQQGLDAAGEAVSETADDIGNGIVEGVQAIGAWGNANPTLLSGAAPLLMGALMGDIGEGARVGGENIYNRYNEVSKHNTAFRRIADKGASNKPTFKDVYNPATGKTTINRWDGQKWVDTGAEKGSASKDVDYQENLINTRSKAKIREYKTLGKGLKLTEGPDGQKVIWDKVNKRTSELFPGQNFQPNQKKVISKAQDFVRAKLEPDVASYRKMQDAMSGFKRGETLAMKGALMNVAKEAQGGGKLSDFDVEFLQYSFGRTRWKEAATEYATGRMNPRLAREIESRMEANIKRTRKGLVRKFSRVYRMGEVDGVSSSQMRKILGGEGFDRAVIKVNGKEMSVPAGRLDSLIKQERYKDLEVIRYE
jgi:hypothetical protein